MSGHNLGKLNKRPLPPHTPRLSAPLGASLRIYGIKFGCCDIKNNQGLGKGYQPQPSALYR